MMQPWSPSLTRLVDAPVPTGEPSTHRDHPPRILILGGGLAGLAAGVRLADLGYAVHLLETRKRLGGRAGSFVDPDTGAALDNCQHVLLRCCTSLRDFYHRLRLDHAIDWHQRMYLVDERGRTDVLAASPLPAPLHLGLAFLRMRSFTVRDKFVLARAMQAALRLGARRRQWHDRSFLHWLETHGQTPRVIDRFWRMIMVSALNEELDRCAADAGLQVVQESLLAQRDAYWMGLSHLPLSSLYAPARWAIESAGGRVELGASVRQLEPAPSPNTTDSEQPPRIAAVRLADGRRLSADLIIAALPWDRLAAICPPELRARDRRFTHAEAHESSPIIGIHLWFDRPTMPHPHVMLPGSPLHWLFRKHAGDVRAGAGRTSPTRGLDQPPPSSAADEHHVHGVISAARDLVDAPAADIAAMAHREMSLRLPAARDAQLRRHLVIKEKRATFAVRPGVDAIRPKPAGAVANLFIAGDWTDTGWPATMEGAVRSGNLAAESAFAFLQHRSAATINRDQTHDWLYRVLAGRSSRRSPSACDASSLG